MRYKYSLNPKIKGYVEWQLEHYAEDKKQLEQYKQSMIPSITPGYSLTGGTQSGGTSNPTEAAGLRMATNPYIVSTERSIKAVETVLGKCDETDLKLIDLIYWKQSYTVEGAGMKVGLSRRAAYYRINNILCVTALEMGLVTL